MRNIQQSKRALSGFTLIELLLYVTVSATVLVGIVSVLAIVLQARIKYQTVTEVEEQGRAAMTIMTQSIRNSLGVNTPTSTNSSSTLSLIVSDSSKNPTIFLLNNSTLVMKEGVTTTALTSSQVLVTNLLFTNLSSTSTSGTVRIKLLLDYYNQNGGGNNYQYSQTFNGSAGTRY